MDSLLDDKDFYVVRKNLNILSVLILLFAFTNAKIEILNFLGIQINLDGVKFYMALYIGYVYIIWRFITKLPLNEKFWQEFLREYMNTDKGVKSKYNYERFKETFLKEHANLAWLKQNDEKMFFVMTNVTRLGGNRLNRLRLSAVFQRTIPLPDEKFHNPQLTFDLDINVPHHFMLRKFLVFCIRRDKFGDYLFPFIPFALNLGFVLFKTNWQGSFSQLF